MSSFSTSLDRASPHVLGILRIVAALLFMEHGIQKLLAFPAPFPMHLTTLLTVQAYIEVIGGALLLVGLFTRIVAFVLCGDMAVAYLMAHYPKSFYPALNGGDAAVLFCFAFLYLAVAGGGAFSLDRAIGSRE